MGSGLVNLFHGAETAYGLSSLFLSSGKIIIPTIAKWDYPLCSQHNYNYYARINCNYAPVELRLYRLHVENFDLSSLLLREFKGKSLILFIREMIIIMTTAL